MRPPTARGGQEVDVGQVWGAGGVQPEVGSHDRCAVNVLGCPEFDGKLRVLRQGRRSAADNDWTKRRRPA